MAYLRYLAEKDLSQTLEGEFSIPVVLIDPAGERIDKTVDGRQLGGRVLWTRKEVSGDGESIVVFAPIITLRESSLSRVPKSGEHWFVEIPESPREGAPMTSCLLDQSAAVEGGKSLGFINLPLVAVEHGEH